MLMPISMVILINTELNTNMFSIILYFRVRFLSPMFFNRTEERRFLIFSRSKTSEIRPSPFQKICNIAAKYATIAN